MATSFYVYGPLLYICPDFVLFLLVNRFLCFFWSHIFRFKNFMLSPYNPNFFKLCMPFFLQYINPLLFLPCSFSHVSLYPSLYIYHWLGYYFTNTSFYETTLRLYATLYYVLLIALMHNIVSTLFSYYNMVVLGMFQCIQPTYSIFMFLNIEDLWPQNSKYISFSIPLT
jgi:hypothetical protein